MLSDHRVMLADFSCNEQVFYLLLKYKPRPGAGKEQERGLWWLPRTRLFLLCKAQSVSFCIPQQQVAVNRNGIALAQEAQVFGLGCAGGDGGKSDGLEGAARRRERPTRLFRQLHINRRAQPHEQFLTAPTRRNQPNAHFDQPNIGFGISADMVSMHNDLAAAAQSAPCRSRHDGNTTIFEQLVRLLQGLDGLFKLLPL